MKGATMQNESFWDALVQWLHGVGVHVTPDAAQRVEQGAQVASNVASGALAQLDMSGLLALAAALGWASGLRLYAVVFAIGGAGALGWVALPPGLAMLTHPLVLTVSGCLLLVEFFADKVPWLDSLWDAVNAFLRVPGGALLAAFSFLFRKTLKRFHKKVQEADGRLRMFLQERIGSLFLIRSFAAEAQTEAGAADKMREHLSARMRRNSFTSLCSIGFGAAMTGMYLFGVGWCGYGILTGSISFGTLTAITQLITQIQSPFANITGYLPRYYAMLASAERLMEAEAFPESMEEAKPLEDITAFYENELVSFGLSDASFAYLPPSDDGNENGGRPAALEHLSLEIRKGEYVAFTGQSGCGKSTAQKLLMCVYQPDSGERYYSDRSGVRGGLTGAYRRLFAYVPQGNALMNGSIREVVSFAAPEAARDEERLTRALRIACAEDFVSELDHGADTLLGERGAGLSEGQMQRLAVARAVFSGSPVLLLDEATSALDADTERQLLLNLRELTDRTVVIVSHRPAALSICDRVLTFTENGVLHD